MSRLEGFTEQSRCYEGSVKVVFRRGSGPGVIIVHEMPGLTPEVARFGKIVADRGYTVFLPVLFGQPGRPFRFRDVGAEVARSCINREFHVLSRRRRSPVTDWLRGLCRDVHGELGGPGVGVVGMCFTGNFALGMLADPTVMAPVLSQPSLPFSLSTSHRAALQLSPDELAEIQRRTREEGLTVLGLRFTADLMCPGSRFTALREALGEGFEGVEIPSGPGNPHGIPPIAHSVLARDLVDEVGHPTRAALDRVLAFLDERLKPDAQVTPPVA
jgi:dienelactone hydrolase